MRRITEGKGADFVIEIGGRGTIGKSIRSTRRGGLVAVSGKSGSLFKIIAHLVRIGYLSTYKDIPKEILEEDLAQTTLAQTILYSGSYVRGVFVCNREDEKRMISALEVGNVKPVIDKVCSAPSKGLKGTGGLMRSLLGFRLRKSKGGISVHG